MEYFCQCIAGDVVHGRAEPSAGEYEARAPECFLNSAPDSRNIVGDGGVAHELKADVFEHGPEVPCMRIDRLPAEQFVANGYEFCLNVHSVLLKVRSHLEVMNELNQSLSVEVGGVRLDVFLAAAVPAVSRSHWKTLIQDGRAVVNGRTCKPNHKLKAGDTVSWAIPEAAETEPQPEEIPLDILFEDDALLVLNKQAGRVVHPAPGNTSGTLVNALLFHDSIFESVERAGIVHRLDKDTSGVMVVAKTEAAMTELQRQFKARETEKEYLALVWGSPPPSGRIETQIGRHPKHRQKMAVLKEGGRVAVSSFKVLESFAETTWVQVKIETGRTHQIRVHMAHLGHPVVGDAVYGRARKGNLQVNRQMLHAAKLGLMHPCSGKRLSFEAPLFDDMRLILEKLRTEDHG